jgi:LacI family transcriptional regulator
MRHVAALAGVGVKTVSRVINGEPNVSAATIAKVTAAARTLDYQPDLHAGNLRRADGRTRTLGLLVGSVDNPFAGAVHRAVEDAALQHGVAVFASSLDDDPEREQEAVAAFLRRRVDGLILTTVSESQAYLAPELRRGTPVVFVDREPAGITSDAVVSDNAEGAALATRHLLERGHRRSPTSATVRRSRPRGSVAAGSSRSWGAPASRPAACPSSRDSTTRSPPAPRPSRCSTRRRRPRPSSAARTS